jgi:chorismate-pyruvate lyase
MNWSSTPTLESLYALFPAQDDRPTATLIAGEDVPEPYRGLLVHDHHMTVTVERFYGDAVDVVVLEQVREPEHYARKILLKLKSTGQVVQFGIVKIRLPQLPEQVCQEILSGQIPLGRILIEHDVLRTVHPHAFFRVELGSIMAEWFDHPEGSVTFGRIGVITADGEPAIQVAEILAPLPITPPAT